MTPTEQDKKLEVALMELFCRSEEFGRTFLTCASKEEFAEAVNGGALDHQQAAHEAMQLITQYGDTRERLGRIDERQALHFGRKYGRDYQATLEDLEEENDKRLAELKEEV